MKKLNSVTISKALAFLGELTREFIMILTTGSKGPLVKELQQALEIETSGIFDQATEKAVKIYQQENELLVDGIVGPQTLEHIHQSMATTDVTETIYSPYPELQIHKHFLPPDQYVTQPTDKDFLFLHHTAGWHNPYKTIDGWAKDQRGKIATEFVLGGKSVRGDNESYDGELVQCIPNGCYGWHLGKTGSSYMHKHSIGVELCNFSYAVDGKTYVKTPIESSQIISLPQAFKGYKTWHAYSDKQIEALKKLILWIAQRDSIDIHQGLITQIKKQGAKAFEFNPDAYAGKIKGMWTHGNVRKDKFDLFPQAELIDMLVSL
ncbi:MAG: N-acetylmuramoyl-L-alanine amidase [Enterobacterales bacterium]|nr:N-acetylmuramoyl-L-alanine amidase [Enterobacterales bacterium]